MRRTIILFTGALAVFGIVAERVAADRQHIAFVTSQRLKQICGQLDGTFWSSGSGYSCSNECGKKGGGAWCAVDCSGETKECVGRAPTRVEPGGSAQRVLNNGALARTRPKGNVGDARATPTPAQMINSSGTDSPNEQQPRAND
jgi:hypothetical protein